MTDGKRTLVIIFLFLTFFLIPSSSVLSAESEYVLPYPSVMPGSKFYLIRTFWEKISYYWHFGNFSQFKYNLNQSDKYLVEAKTLFEYKQYLLGVKALEKSDDYFSKIEETLKKGEQEGKNISQKRKILQNAALKHDEVLEEYFQKIPEEIEWKPEKEKVTKIQLHRKLIESIQIRKKEL